MPLRDAIDLGGTIRAAPVATTLAKARSVIRAVGITRIANVTGLDHVGIPTWQVVRPLARSLTVSQGKGLSDSLAQASGIMESIELHHAEFLTPRGHWRSLGDAARDDRYANPLLLPVHPDRDVREGSIAEWIEGIDIASGGVKFVPRDCIDLDSLDERARNRLFVASSNGLASGNTTREAILHGLCEVIERDQGSFWYARKNLVAGAPAGRLRLDTVSDEHCRWLIERCRAAGLEIAVWSTAHDIALPSFNCIIFDGRRQTYYPQRAEGSGCHPYRHIALSRAITEALQSRLTNIAGGRDDLYWARFRDTLCIDNGAGDAWIATMECEEFDLDFDDVVQAPALPSIDELLAWVVAALGSQGLSQVIVVDLTRDDIGIPVVHVTVPGLESIAGKPGFTPGPRMQSFLAAHRLL
ncbi:MAG TPA: YcaO-like family protein [Casimicrobiaceae bacterium]|nr:YcaO-like family protein [Casimicrobiaceae bacterium]